jgi:hypothetical protein
MQSIGKLEASAASRPNSIEVNEALADAYAKEGRWREAAETYRALLALYPATALLFINRIRLGATALGIASFLVLLGQIARPILSNAQTNPLELADQLASSEYMFAQISLLLAFPLLSTAAISIYKLLSYSHDHHAAFWAMVICLLGTGLSMATLGIHAVVLPLIGRLYLSGDVSAIGLYGAMQEFPTPMLLQAGNYLLALGILVFSWVLWRSQVMSKWATVLHAAGWVLFAVSSDQISRPFQVFIGSLIALGGMALARAIWIQASLQFKPKNNSLHKAAA